MRLTSEMGPDEVEAGLLESALRCWGSERLDALRGIVKRTAKALWLVSQTSLLASDEGPDVAMRPECGRGERPVQLYELCVNDAVRAMQTGELSPVDLVQSVLRRIADTEGKVQAWECLDAERALATADHLESKGRELWDDCPLFGLPVGVKDVFHVLGLPTSANFEPYRGSTARFDSGIVEQLRKAGAIILGKTVTVQFAAGQDPPKTCNPWALERSPGGSSSGSAAAVSAMHVPAAIGTQTGGSTLRPAAFCGVVGLKPTFGRLSRYGLIPASWSLDHVGIIARTVVDTARVFQALALYDSRDPSSLKTPLENCFKSVEQGLASQPCIGLVRDLVERADPLVREGTESALARLKDGGAEVREVKLCEPLDLVLAAHHLIFISELAAVHAAQLDVLAEHYRPSLRGMIEVGQLVPAAIYVQALRLRRRLRIQMLKLFENVDFLVAPTVSEFPPLKDTGTGDASFQAIWSLVGFPNLTLPTGISKEHLPEAMQIICRPLDEGNLFRAGAWIESIFGHLPSPKIT